MTRQIHARDIVEAFRFALSCAGVKDVRWYLNGVAFEVADGVFRWIGTDGNRIAVVESAPLAEGAEAPPVGRYVVKREAVAQMLKAFGKLRPTDLAIVFCEPSDPEGLHISVGSPPGLPIRVALIADQRFPDWRRAEPHQLLDGTATPGKAVGVNAKYLADAGKACARLANSKYHGVKVRAGSGEGFDKSGGLLFEPGISPADFPDLAKAYIYCMPMGV